MFGCNATLCMLVACGREWREEDTLGKAMRFEGTAFVDEFEVIWVDMKMKSLVDEFLERDL